MPDSQLNDNLYKRGDVIGGTYEISGVLGKGGFGVVHHAIHKHRGEPCALKTFRDEFLADASARKAFEKEALLWVNLDEHPFVLAAQCVREFSGRLFIDMDLVPRDVLGRVTLNDHLAASEPLAQERALEWAIQFCFGMEHATSHGIACHRDIKPANILICNGALKISDFGLASAAEQACNVTASRSGSIQIATGKDRLSFSVQKSDGKARCGTPGYMPPEVFRGDAADLRSDIYSFGLVLWQMATRSPIPPFVGRFRGDRDAFARDAYERQMSGRLPSTPELWRGVVENCLKRQPAGRYATFTALREALEPIFAHLTRRTISSPTIASESAAFWNNKGMSLAALGQWQEAIASYDKALALNPQQAKIWCNKGFALQEIGWLEEAIYCYDRALAMEPRLDGIWSNKATALAALGRHEAAIQCHNEALSLNSQDAAMWNNKGDALCSQRRFNEAINCFDQAIAIDARYAEAWNNRGVALGFLGAHEDAIASYKRALAINPQYAGALYNIGLLLSALNNPREAIRFYAASLAINPNDASVWFTKANQLDALECYEEALGCYDKALRVNPRDVQAWNNKGGTFVNMKRFPEAIECYEAALAVDSKDARHWFNKAYAEDTQEELLHASQATVGLLRSRRSSMASRLHLLDEESVN